MARPTLEELGSRRSLLGARFIGLMRWTAATVGATAVAGSAALTWAAVEARRPTLRRFTIEVPSRPGLEKMNILHVSDLHMFDRQKFIPKFLKRVADTEHIDLVVSTGDNLGAEDAAPLLLEALEPLLSKPGVFVLGSNDYYSPDMKAWTSYLDPSHQKETAQEKGSQHPDLPWFQVVQALKEAGWVDLSNQAHNLRVPLASPPSDSGQVNGSQPDGREALVSAIGVDDPHILRDHMPEPTKKWRKGRGLRLALTHSPYLRVLDEFAAADADLVLAGHTHGGQIRVPGFGALVNNTDIPRKYSRGMHRWHGLRRGPNPWLHVSAGLGTSKYAPIRFSCRPEVSLITVCPTGK